MVIFNLKKIGVDLDLDLSKNETDLIKKNLPIELIDGSIVDITGKKRCILEFKNRIIVGGYGILQELFRINEKGRLICFVKYSKEKSFNILNEALLQYISYTILKKYIVTSWYNAKIINRFG